MKAIFAIGRADSIRARGAARVAAPRHGVL